MPFIFGFIVTFLATTATLLFWLVGGAVMPEWWQAMAIGWGIFAPVVIVMLCCEAV